MRTLIDMLKRMCLGFRAAEDEGGGADDQTNADATTDAAAADGDGQTTNDGQTAPKGDLTKALRAERESNRALKAQLAEMARAKEEKAEPLDVSAYMFTEEEVMNADAAAMNAKLAQALQAVAGVSTRTVAQTLAAQSAEAILAEYEIFDDPDVGEYAAFKAMEALKALPKTASGDLRRQTIEDVARKVSRFKADAEQEPPPVKRPPSKSGGGGAEAAHLKAQAERPKSDADAREITRQAFGVK